jgi:hypothetical protein
VAFIFAWILGRAGLVQGACAGYQTRINAVLRAFVHARRRAEHAGQKPKSDQKPK